MSVRLSAALLLTMTEQEATRRAAKLTRIWMPDGSFGDGASWTLEDRRFRYTAHLTDDLKMWFGESNFCEGEGYHLERLKDGVGSALWYCPQNGSHIVSSQSNQEPTEFAEMYLRLMRSHCWLSGCPIESSDKEQTRWDNWQREREAEGAGEPTNTVEWEVNRVAAAFGIEEVAVRRNPARVHYEGWLGDVLVTWELGDPNARVKNIYVGTGSYSGVYWNQGRWHWEQGQEGYEQLARALYRLGIEDEAVLAELDVPLSMHEKMELRLSMPRKFWPLQWRNETAGSQTEEAPS